jgi:diacylglycerol kinase (ATP)
VIFNPTAKGEKAQRFRRHLDDFGSHWVLMGTEAAGDARRLAAKAVEQGFERIIAAGGDGTVNEVLNGLGDAPDGFERACLGVLPLGTVNVFARELALPTRLELAWQTVLQGREVRIDLPSVRFGADAKVQCRYFAQLGGAGLDARAVELVHWPLKKRIGSLAYIFAGLKALCGPPAKISVEADGASSSGELVLVGNGRFYGGNFRIFPDADLRDGLLDVCVFPRVNWLTLARCGPRLLLRGSLPGASAQLFTANRLTLSAAAPTPLEVDGELAGRLPATFSLDPARLRVIVP